MNRREMEEGIRAIGERAAGFGHSGISDDHELVAAVNLFITCELHQLTVHHEEVRQVALSAGWSDNQATKVADVADVVRFTVDRLRSLGRLTG